MNENGVNTPQNQQQGLFRKFDVRRVDGKDNIGHKHHGCDYFVLDLSHDPHAYNALLAYSESCKNGYPELSKSLLLKAVAMRKAGIYPPDTNKSTFSVRPDTVDI